MANPEDTLCYEAITHVDEAMRDAVGDTNYYVLGGITSSAIKHEATVFDHEARTIHAPLEASDGVIRPNGTVRDIDVLVDRIITDEEAEIVIGQLEKALGGTMVVSVFGFDPHKAPTKAGSALRTFTDWTSRRTIDQDGVRRYELNPLSQEVSEDSYLPWTLETEAGSSVSVLSPAGHVLAYGLRSISGVRAKDTEKLGEMLERVLSEPEFKDAIVSGEFRSWLDFAVSVYNLRDGINPDEVGRIAQRAFRFKGKLLGALESNEKIVAAAQEGIIQDALKFFVHAK